MRMIFNASPCRSRWEGIFAISWVLLIDVLLFLWLGRRSPDWVSFVLLVGILISVPLLIHLIYRTWGAFNLSYRLDRDALTIRWAATTQVVPLSAIRRVIRSGNEVGGWVPWLWPAPFVRTGRGQRSRRLERYASRSLPSCLLLETDDTIFALSPLRSDAFLEAMNAYHRLGPIQLLPQERRRPLMGTEALLDRPSMWLLGLGALGVLVLFGVLMTLYPNLPERLVMQYNSTGAPDSIRSKDSLFVLPIISLAAYMVNGIGGVWMAYRKQRLGAYLLWGGTLVVQVLVLLALFSLIG